MNDLQFVVLMFTIAMWGAVNLLVTNFAIQKIFKKLNDGQSSDG